MRERHSGWLARIVIILICGTAVYMAIAETERFAWAWHLVSEEWHGVAVQLGLGGFCLWRALRALGIRKKPCPACGGSGKGDWPTEDANGNTVHVCGQCRGITATYQRGSLVRGILLASVAGFCLMYGLIQLSHLWARPLQLNPAASSPGSSAEK